MSFNAMEFRSKVGSPLRNNKFLMTVDVVPPGLRGTSFEKLMPDLKFWGESIDIPAISLMTGEVKPYGYGPAEKRPYAPIFEDCRLSMRGDQDGRVFAFMKAWQALAVNHEMVDTISDPNGRVGSGGPMGTSQLTATPFEVGYKEDYAVPVSITVFRDDGKQSFKVTMVDAYPIIVGPTVMAWEAMNDFARLPVSLAFSQIGTLGVRFGTGL